MACSGKALAFSLAGNQITALQSEALAIPAATESIKPNNINKKV
jgi:hypothetical protein